MTGHAFFEVMNALNDSGWSHDDRILLSIIAAKVFLLDPLSLRRTRCDCLYCFGNTCDNQSSLLDAAAVFWRVWRSNILINRGETEHGYPGFEVWYKELRQRGVLPKNIIPLDAEVIQRNVNTLSEAKALVDEAQRRRWGYIAISTAPFHQLRAFITTVSVLLKKYPMLQVYNQVGQELPWEETVRHSQGTLVATRRELVGMELGSILRYHHQGDLVSPKEILSYIET